MTKKDKIKIEHYPIYKPMIDIPFPEFADAVDMLMNVEASLDKTIQISRDTAWALYEIAAQIPEPATQQYYVRVIRKWLNTEPVKPITKASD